MKKQAFTLIVAGLVAVCLILFLMTFIVHEGNLIILTTFAEPTKIIEKPGFYWKLPWPIQSAESYPRRVQVLDGRPEQVLTADQKTIIITASLGWRVSNDDKAAIIYRERVGSAASAEEKLRTLLSDRKNEVIGRYQLNNFISTDPAQMKFPDIENEMLTAIGTAARNQYGIEVALFRLKRLELPPDSIAQVQQRMKDERAKEIKGFEGQGNQIASTIRAEAERQRSNLLAMANAEAQAIRGRGEAKVVEFADIFKQEPKLAIWLRSIRALENITKKNTTVVLDSKDSLVESIMNDIDMPGDLVSNPGAKKAGSSAPAKGE